MEDQENKTSTVASPEVSINVTLDTASITDIHVVAEEDKLIAKEADLQRAINEALTHLSTLSSERDKVLKNLAKAEETKMAKKGRPMLKSLGFPKVVFSVTARIADATGIDISRFIGKDNGNGSFSFTKRIKYTPAIKALTAKMDDANDNLRNLRDELLSIRSKLSNMDRIVRRARAAMAVRALEQTPQGRMMLKGIRSDVKALPAPKD